MPDWIRNTYNAALTERFILKGLDEGLNDVTQEIFAISQDIVADEAIDESTLLKSGFMDIDQLTVKTVGYTAAHAPSVHFGRRPGGKMPPIKALIGWVRRNVKSRTGNFGGRKVRIHTFKPTALHRGTKPKKDEAEKLAWAIAKNIQKNGTPPVRFLTRARDAVAPKAQGMVAERVQAQIRQHPGARGTGGA